MRLISKSQLTAMIDAICPNLPNINQNYGIQ